MIEKFVDAGSSGDKGSNLEADSDIVEVQTEQDTQWVTHTLAHITLRPRCGAHFLGQGLLLASNRFRTSVLNDQRDRNPCLAQRAAIHLEISIRL
jgi:hypothetical protein